MAGGNPCCCGSSSSSSSSSSSRSSISSRSLSTDSSISEGQICDNPPCNNGDSPKYFRVTLSGIFHDGGASSCCPDLNGTYLVQYNAISGIAIMNASDAGPGDCAFAEFSNKGCDWSFGPLNTCDCVGEAIASVDSSINLQILHNTVTNNTVIQIRVLLLASGSKLSWLVFSKSYTGAIECCGIENLDIPYVCYHHGTIFPNCTVSTPRCNATGGKAVITSIGC